jgi:hypothetical protein
MPIDLTIHGRRYGHLITYYGRGHDITCRCVCRKLVHVAVAALLDGTVTSCGCRPSSPAFREQCRDLRAQARRETQFAIARTR